MGFNCRRSGASKIADIDAVYYGIQEARNNRCRVDINIGCRQRRNYDRGRHAATPPPS
ncbi:MAG: hypothetical protein PHT19_16240 [Methylococcus sp.]|nr:hypothetical protein [Methylococcus sp.]